MRKAVLGFSYSGDPFSHHGTYLMFPIFYIAFVRYGAEVGLHEDWLKLSRQPDFMPGRESPEDTDKADVILGESEECAGSERMDWNIRMQIMTWEIKTGKSPAFGMICVAFDGS